MPALDARFCIDLDNVLARTDEVMRRVISDFSGGKVQLDYEDIVKFNYSGSVAEFVGKGVGKTAA